MPRVVDHDRRREALARALVEVALRDGLHAVPLRAVAEQAGVSLGQLQHYVESKAALTRLALQVLERDSHARWAARMRDLPDPPPQRAFVEAFVDEALPDDGPSRAFHQLFLSAMVLGMTDVDLAGSGLASGPDRLERQLSDVLAEARRDGNIRADDDVATIATGLVTMVHGLGTSVLLGQRTPAAARAVVDDHLDRIFLRG